MSVELQSQSEHKDHAHNGTAPSPISNATAAANSASAGATAGESQLQQSQAQSHAPLPHPAKSAHLSLLYSGNNTLYCGGRFIVGPGPDAFLATALVILVPGAVFIGTTSVHHPAAAARRHAGRWCAERGVACATTVRLDRESALLRLHSSNSVRRCASPLLPPPRSAVSFIDLIGSGWWVLVVSCVLLVLTLYFLTRASTSDPGIFLRLPPEPTYKWHAISQELNVDGRNVQLRYCRQCSAGQNG